MPLSTTACPTDDALLAHASGLASAVESQAISAHLAECADCCTVLAEAARAMGGSAESDLYLSRPSGPERALPRAGDRVGRYSLLEVLGQGAMGVVYAAYDPELDRRVAVKLVRAGAASGELDARLLREAQAMARMSHPNVVAVYDIGSIDAGVWLAMELVVGSTLRAWLAASPRSWQEILATCLQAGDGLAAAHASGIVHRDFKPDNVLINRDGRAQVTDFGLARLDDLPLLAADASSDLTTTRAGTVLGTPAYMPPEQLAGTVADVRADVFAFGATLYEAFYGARPYRGATLGELKVALDRGVPAAPPPSRVPAWVRRAVLRALAGDPAVRFQTMDAFTQALRNDPARRLRQWGIPVVAAAVITIVSGVAWQTTTAPARACRAGADRADAVWGADRQQAARAAFGALGLSYADAVLDRVSPAVLARLDAWRAARIDACDDTHVRGEQSQALLDRRLGCLDARLGDVDALAAVLLAPDADVVQRAPEAVEKLPAVGICAEVDRLTARVAPPDRPEDAARAAEAGTLIAQARADTLTARWKDALDRAGRAVALATEAKHPPSQAEATAVLAEARFRSGDMTGAETTYREALLLGLAAGDDRVAADAALGLAVVRSQLTRSTEESLRWVDFAEAEAKRLGGADDVLLDARLTRAEAYFNALQAKEALPDLLAAADALAGREDQRRLRTLGDLASAQQQTEDYAAATKNYEDAVAIAERAFGPGHPQTVSLRANLGGCLTAAGRNAAAVRELESALAVQTALYPRFHPDQASLRAMYAAALAGVGRYDEAEAQSRDALAIETEVYKDNQAQSALTATMLAQTQIAAGRGGEALASLALAKGFGDRFMPGRGPLSMDGDLLRAMALEAEGRDDEASALYRPLEAEIRAAMGEGTELAMTLDGLGRQLVRTGHPDEAVSKHREALAIRESHEGEEGPGLSETLRPLARALLAARYPTEAAATAERAVRLLEKGESAPLDLAEARFILALALPRGDRADALAAEARQVAGASPYPRGARLAREIAAWQAR